MSSFFRLNILVCLLLVLPVLSTGSRKHKCRIFNMGDSNTDVGGWAAIGHDFALPFGQTYFGKPTGRASDGRLYIDFLCDHLKIKFLDAYLESSGSSFKGGVNFAYSGTGVVIGSMPLSTQVQQFRHFRNRTRELFQEGKGSMITEKQFEQGIFSIDLGQNDLVAVITNTSAPFELAMKDMLSQIMLSIEEAIKELYNLGGRKFVVYGTGPLGCLSREPPQTPNYDEAGCDRKANNASKTLNDGLSNVCELLQWTLADAKIVYIDMFSIKYELFVNPSLHGFEKPRVPCLDQSVCRNVSRAVLWDYYHYTDAANYVIAQKILSGKYARPYGAKIQDLCIGG